MRISSGKESEHLMQSKKEPVRLCSEVNKKRRGHQVTNFVCFRTTLKWTEVFLKVIGEGGGQ